MKRHEFLVRASRLGDLMASDRSGKGLGLTAKKVILEAVLFNKYGIEPKEITNKYLEKGLANEVEGIKLASKVLGWLDIDTDKPKVRLSNDYVVGEPDVNEADLVADIKNSWDAFTFPYGSKEIPTKGYEYQLLAYLWLTGKKKASLVYTLTDSPEHTILDETNRLVWKNTANPKYAHLTQSEIEQAIEDKVRQSLTFSDKIPAEKRVKEYVVEYNDEAIEKIKERIDLARLEYDKLYNEI
jgi:hypothetical protein